MRTLTMITLVSLFLAVCVHTAQAQIPRTFSYQGVLTDATGTAVADGSYTITFALYDSPNTPSALWSESQIVSVSDGIVNTQIGSVEPVTLSFDQPYYLGIAIDGGKELLPRTALSAAPYALVSMRAETAGGLEPGATGVVTSVNTLSGEIAMEGGGGTTVTRSGNKILISSTGGTGGTGIQGVQNTDGSMTVDNPTGPIATLGLAEDGIAGSKLRDLGITTAKLADGSVTAAKVQQNEVVKSVEVDGTTLRDDIVLEAGNNVTLTPSGSKITISSTGGSGGTGIQGVQNTDGTIDVQDPNGPVATVSLADGAVTTPKIAAGQVVRHVKVGTVVLQDEVTLKGGNNVILTPNGNEITIESTGGSGGTGIQGVQCTNGTLKIENSTGPIATINVADSAIGSQQLAANALPSALPPNGVAGGDLDGSYPNPAIATGAVRTAALAAGAVTSGKLANGSVTSAKLASGVIPTSLPPSGSAGGDLDGSYPNPAIADDAVTAPKLADASVTAAKLSATGAQLGQFLGFDGVGLEWRFNTGGITGSGGANRLAIWSGTSVLSDNANLVYASGKLGIGTNAPSTSVHIVGTEGVLAEGTYTSGTALSLGVGTRMHWYPKKAAFRAGRVSGARWDDANIGVHSVAMGLNTDASGGSSVSLGESGIASGDWSTSIGLSNIASDIYATAMGFQNTASADAATALGWKNTASADGATALGGETTASGVWSVAMGYQCEANALASTAMGWKNTASGGSAVALGELNVASGDYSAALGYKTTASKKAATAMGSETTASGDYSTAMGGGAIAVGLTSTAMGASTYASGDGSTAMGVYTVATGNNSTAMGFTTKATGTCSTAMGSETTASGDYSTAMGSLVSTGGYSGTFVLGDNSSTALLTANGQHLFWARFHNGYRFYTNSTCTNGVYMTNNDNSWHSVSDSTRKDEFHVVNAEQLLQRFRLLRLGSWKYKHDTPDRRHYGPMAQEWFSAFGHDGVGTIGTDTSLGTADVDGILCIAIKALEARTAQLSKMKADLKMKTHELEEVKETLNAQKEALRAEQHRNRIQESQMHAMLTRISMLEQASLAEDAPSRVASAAQVSQVK